MNQFYRKRYQIDLPGVSRPAIIEINRYGQDYPDHSDEVMVHWRILLPADDGDLLKELQFGHRVIVAGGGLYDNWGAATDDLRHRSRSGLLVGRTLSIAFAKAAKKTADELLELVEALQMRQVAMNELCCQVDEEHPLLRNALVAYDYDPPQKE